MASALIKTFCTPFISSFRHMPEQSASALNARQGSPKGERSESPRRFRKLDSDRRRNDVKLKRLVTSLPLIGVLLLSACQAPQPEVREQQFIAFGTLINVTLYDVDAAQADQAFASLEKDLNQWHHDWHAWQPGPLKDLNQSLAEHGEAEVPATLLPLISSTQIIAKQSAGLFDPSIGGLLALWGFQADEPALQPPTAERVSDWLKNPPSMSDLQLHGHHLSSPHRGAQLDFGACAKGYAAQLASSRLSELGIHNALIGVAGDIRAAGTRGERPWRVGIRHPRAQGVLGAVELHDGESISTSGDYQRYFTYQEQRYHHLLDPRSGYPANTATSVTVIARDGLRADAAATALFIAGPEEWPRIARALGIEQVLRIDTQGEITMTPAMATRLQLEGKPKVHIQDLH